MRRTGWPWRFRTPSPFLTEALRSAVLDDLQQRAQRVAEDARRLTPPTTGRFISNHDPEPLHVESQRDDLPRELEA